MTKKNIFSVAAFDPGNSGHLQLGQLVANKVHFTAYGPLITTLLCSDFTKRLHLYAISFLGNLEVP